jgi:hypothetical protein
MLSTGLAMPPSFIPRSGEQDAVDAGILAQATADSGAVVMGRRLFDIVNGPGGWSKTWGTAPTRRERRRSSW